MPEGDGLSGLRYALFQRLNRYTRRTARETAAGEVIVFEVLDMAQDCFARVEALGPARLFGKVSRRFSISGGKRRASMTISKL